jgi:hypothetical protein
MSIVFYIFSIISFLTGVWVVSIFKYEDELLGYSTQNSNLMKSLGYFIMIISIFSFFYIHKI